MPQVTDPTLVHCYTNPSFCRQSEYISGEQNDVPPSPQFQGEDLPLPPPPQQLQIQCDRSDFDYQGQPEASFESSDTLERYCYLEQQPKAQIHRRYSSLPVDEFQTCSQISRYEYIHGEEKNQLQRRGSSRYELIPRQQEQCSTALINKDDLRLQLQNGGNIGQYDVLDNQDYRERELSQVNVKHISPIRRHLNTPQAGRYTRVSLQEEDPPALPERNAQVLSVSLKNNTATQKLHEILATPRKPRSNCGERTLSPKRQQVLNQTVAPQRRILTPSSPSGRAPMFTQRESSQGTPQNRNVSLNGPQTSTPNKEPSARRCLPLSEYTTHRQDICPASNCGRLRYMDTAPVDFVQIGHGGPPQRYAYLENGTESMPMVAGSLKYQVIPPDQKRNGYQSADSAFTARTAIVPPLSPPNSDVNTTLTSGLGKNERQNAPLLLILVGILTCGLALYLSWTQGRRYYFDSAVGCGACCALAGACRSLRRTWTGLGLAGLSALSCAGLLLLAAKSPKPGSPIHDVTAGALCGVSLVGASLALLALLTPKCTFGRHRRVHSWIPRLSP